MKTAGRGSLQLFKVHSDVERIMHQGAADRLYEKLGLEKPAGKKLQQFDFPMIPEMNDFFMFPFRHISATVVGSGTYKATDFSNDGVLKKSTKYLTGKPAFLNHQQITGTEVGVVGEVEWVNAYTHTTGVKIPGGIEGPFVIDSKLHGDLVRKMSSPVSPINSSSVSVDFEWEASHEFERDSDFYWHLGEMIDGTEVRRIVKEVVDYYESSLVWLGADPYARMLDSKGEIVVIDRATAFARQKFSDLPNNEKYNPSHKFFVFDCLDKEKFLHLSKSRQNFEAPKTEKIITMNEALLAFLAAGFGITVDDLKAGKFDKAQAEKFKIIGSDSFAKMKSAEEFTTLSAAKDAAEASVTKLTADLGIATTAKTALEGEKAKLAPLAKVGEAIIVSAKAEAKRAYGLFTKGKPEKTIEDGIEAESDLVKLEANIKMWGGQSITEYGGTCSKCGSTEISFRTSKDTDSEKEKKNAESDKSFEMAALK